MPRAINPPVPTDQFGFQEGNTYQYTFMLPFDYQGLFDAIGDQATVEQRLDKFFKKLVCWGEPCFNMANEPDFVTPYAYTYLGKPWKTAEVVTRIEEEVFNTSSGGIPGNDDLGATSAVYVWNALGHILPSRELDQSLIRDTLKKLEADLTCRKTLLNVLRFAAKRSKWCAFTRTTATGQRCKST